MDDWVVSVLSEIRAEYNLFDPKDEPRYRALSTAIEVLNAHRWISVTERFIHSGWYLVACNEWGGSAVRKAIFDEAAGKWLEFPCGGPKDITKYVTHWQPLPDPPKGETK